MTAAKLVAYTMVVYGSNSEHNSKLRIVNKCYLIKRKVFFANCLTRRFALLLRECCVGGWIWYAILWIAVLTCMYGIYGNGITIENGLTANGMSQKLLLILHIESIFFNDSGHSLRLSFNNGGVWADNKVKTSMECFLSTFSLPLYINNVLFSELFWIKFWLSSDFP